MTQRYLSLFAAYFMLLYISKTETVAGLSCLSVFRYDSHTLRSLCTALMQIRTTTTVADKLTECMSVYTGYTHGRVVLDMIYHFGG